LGKATVGEIGVIKKENSLLRGMPQYYLTGCRIYPIFNVKILISTACCKLLQISGEIHSNIPM